MSLDSVANFVKVTASTGYTDVATSVVLNTGDGAKLPAVPFNLVWWNWTDFKDPSDDPYVEIVRVTNVVSDTLTIVRAQEGTSATAKMTGGKTYKMALALTAKMVTDIQTSLDSKTPIGGVTSASFLQQDLGTGGDVFDVTISAPCTIFGPYSTGNVTIHGINPAGFEGCLLVFINTGAPTFLLKHQSGSGTAGHKLDLGGNADLLVGDSECIWLYYDTTHTEWLLASPTQLRPPGALGTVLTADPAEPTGTKWAASGGGLTQRTETFDWTSGDIILADTPVALQVYGGEGLLLPTNCWSLVGSTLTILGGVTSGSKVTANYFTAIPSGLSYQQDDFVGPASSATLTHTPQTMFGVFRGGSHQFTTGWLLGGTTLTPSDALLSGDTLSACYFY